MSPVDPEIPPVGEEIHLPGASMQPLMLAVGITIALIGVTLSLVLVVAGSLLVVWTVARWIADTRRDISHLPVHSEGAEHH